MICLATCRSSFFNARRDVPENSIAQVKDLLYLGKGVGAFPPSSDVLGGLEDLVFLYQPVDVGPYCLTKVVGLGAPGSAASRSSFAAVSSDSLTDVAVVMMVFLSCWEPEDYL